MRQRVEIAFVTGVAVAIAILIAVGWEADRDTDRLIASHAAVSRTHEVLDNLHQLRSLVDESESASRGFVLSGDERYLQPYLGARPRLAALLQKLEAQTSGDSRLREHWLRLSRLIDDRFAVFSEVIAAARGRGDAAAIAIVRTGRGKALMDEIATVISTMEAEQYLLLEVQNANARRIGRRTTIVVSTAALIAFLFLSWTAWVAWRGFKREAEVQAALRRTLSLQHAILNGADYSIISCDGGGTIRSFNSGAERMLGYSAAEVVGRQTPLLVHDQVEVTQRAQVLSRELGREVPPTAEVFLAKARAGMPDEGEWTYVRKDGSRLPVWLSITGLKDESGRPSGFLGIARDISGYKRAEAAAARLQRQNQLILQCAGEGIYGLDTEYRLTFINPAATAMLGWSAEELLGKPMHDLIHHTRANGRAYPQSECYIHACSVDGAKHTVRDEVYWRKDGTSFPVEYICSPMRDSDSRLLGVVVTFQDITQRREMERMKDEFVSVVSHELRTPLAALHGSLGLLAGKMQSALPPPGQRLLQLALSNSERLVRLLNDILDVQAIDSGVAMNKRACGLAELMTSAAKAMCATAETAGVALSVAPAEAQLWADPERIIQTFTNLLSNAIKFSPPGGRVDFTAAQESDNVTVIVKDQGRGIPADKLQSIFERFRQVDASDSREKGGTGLGLTICRGIVQNHGGRIWAESSGANGSRFYIVLPLACSAADSAAAQATACGGKA